MRFTLAVAISIAVTPAAAKQDQDGAVVAAQAPAEQLPATDLAQPAPSPDGSAAAAGKKSPIATIPDAIVCRREPIIGSRAQFRKVCMTNAQWKVAIRKGNEGTRSIIEAQQTGMNPSN